MPVSAETLRSHVNYSAWASRLLVDSAAQLSEEELTRDFKTSDKCVLGTLVHVFAADRVWLDRLESRPKQAFTSDSDYSLRVLQNDWPALQDRWISWTAGLKDAMVHDVLRYTDLRGNQWEQPIWQIVLHVVNHGTHHRGHVSGFLRALGRTPPACDLIFYYRSLNQHFATS